jgi:hypothetical protein
MIQNMQYRQPTYQNYNRSNNQYKKPAETEKKDSSSGAGSTNLGGQHYDESQLQQQLAFIRKLQQEASGGNPDDKPKEVQVQELHGKLQQLVTTLVDKINKKHESLMLSQQQLKVY